MAPFNCQHSDDRSKVVFEPVANHLNANSSTQAFWSKRRALQRNSGPYLGASQQSPSPNSANPRPEDVGTRPMEYILRSVTGPITRTTAMNGVGELNDYGRLMFEDRMHDIRRKDNSPDVDGERNSIIEIREHDEGRRFVQSRFGISPRSRKLVESRRRAHRGRLGQ